MGVIWIDSARFGVAAPAVLVTSGLATHLNATNSSSYSGSGTTWTDLSGNGRNATLVNGPSYNTAAPAAGITFDGTNDYVALASSSINSNADLTLTFVHRRLSSTPSFQTLLGGLVAGRLQIRIDHAIGITINKSQTFAMGTFSGFIPSLNVDYVLTVTLKKSTNTWSLYANDSFVSSFVSSQTFETTSIGLGINTSTTDPERFSGKMYQFLTYNRELSAAEISQNFNALRGTYGL
jgi:hypothetical protein